MKFLILAVALTAASSSFAQSITCKDKAFDAIAAENGAVLSRVRVLEAELQKAENANDKIKVKKLQNNMMKIFELTQSLSSELCKGI